jgi:IS5 family transposase
MARQPGFFDVEERLAAFSAKGDALEKLGQLVDFEAFRADLERAVLRADRARGGRPPFDHVLMFKVLVLQTSHSLSDERTEYLIKGRLSFMRFLRLSLADAVPDANTIWTFREALTQAVVEGSPAIEILFGRFDAILGNAGFLAMGGQIVDATIVAAPKQRNNDDEKRAIKDGKTAGEIWPDKPAKAAQKDTDARWTVKYSKAKPAADGAKRVDIAIPSFGYKNHIGIDRRHRLIRRWRVTNAARYDGAVLPELLDTANAASRVWADTAYRSEKNEAHLARCGFRSEIHRKKPKGKPMPEHIAKANAARSKVRADVEHVFAWQKGPMALVIRTIGLARARLKIGMANLFTNMRRMIWLRENAAATA